jgi:hypothetical protein
MNAVTFDTLKLARTLQGDGVFTEAQSDRLIEALGDVFAADLATKRDLSDVADDLRGIGGEVRDVGGQVRALKDDVLEVSGKLREAELRLEAKIAEGKAETIKWIFGVVGIQTVAIIGSVFALMTSVRHT